MEGLTYQGLLILLSFSISANFGLADADEPVKEISTITTIQATKAAVPRSSALGPTQYPEEVPEATESVESSDYDLINDTSSDSLEQDNSTDYGYMDTESSTSLVDNESTIIVQLDDDPYNKYKTEKIDTSKIAAESKKDDSTVSRLLHYCGFSALAIGIISAIFIIGYVTWRSMRTASRVSNISAS